MVRFNAEGTVMFDLIIFKFSRLDRCDRSYCIGQTDANCGMTGLPLSGFSRYISSHITMFVGGMGVEIPV